MDLNKEYKETKSGIDPVLRCDSCNKLVTHEMLKKIGSCDKCGNKRVRNVTVFNDEEKAQIEQWGFHEFLNEFESVD